MFEVRSNLRNLSHYLVIHLGVDIIIHFIVAVIGLSIGVRERDGNGYDKHDDSDDDDSDNDNSNDDSDNDNNNDDTDNDNNNNDSDNDNNNDDDDNDNNKDDSDNNNNIIVDEGECDDDDS